MSVQELKKPVPPSVPRPSPFTFSDSSCLRICSARELCATPIWQGNRILDEKHKESIREEIGGNIRSLDQKLYHVVFYPCEEEGQYLGMKRRVIVDGQHRAAILNNYFFGARTEVPPADFNVLVVEKICESEAEIIDYFKILNHVKSIPWKEDPQMIANNFIRALEKEFNKGKQKLIRSSTHRPFLSVDRLRDEIVKRNFEGLSPEKFALLARQINTDLLQEARKKSNHEKMETRAIENGFMLALDDKLRWLDKIRGGSV